jgi:hypothetical protein
MKSSPSNRSFAGPGTLEIGDRARLSPQVLSAVMAANDSAILVLKKAHEEKGIDPYTIS